jgi:hypothetical protein
MPYSWLDGLGMGTIHGYKNVLIPYPCGYGTHGYPYPSIKLPSLITYIGPALRGSPCSLRVETCHLIPAICCFILLTPPCISFSHNLHFTRCKSRGSIKVANSHPISSEFLCRVWELAEVESAADPCKYDAQQANQQKITTWKYSPTMKQNNIKNYH